MMTFVRQSLLLAVLVATSSAAWETAHADDADDQFAVAAGHYDQGRWALAAEEFSKFVQKYPKDRRVEGGFFFLAESLLQSGRFAEARSRFQRYLQREPVGQYVKAATFRVGEAAYLAGDFAAARPDLERFQKQYPKDRLNAFVLAYLGEIALVGGDAAGAAGFFGDGLRQFPDGKLRDDCRVGLARALEKQGRREDAERLFRVVANAEGSSQADAAQFHLGAMQYAQGKYEEAIRTFSAFDDRLNKSPWRSNAQLGHGWALLKLARAAEAVRQFDLVAANRSAGGDLLEQASRGKIQASLRLRDYTVVDREAVEFEKRFPQSTAIGDVRRAAARSLVEQKQYAGAVRILEAAMNAADNKNAPDLESRYLLAVCYEELHRRDDALAALRPVLDRASGSLKAEALLTHGSLLLASKKYAEAVAPFEAFLSQSSRPSPTAAGADAKAEAEAEARALGSLAICLAHIGRLDRAKQRYAELVQKYPGHPLLIPTTEHLAEAVYDAGDTAWSTELSRRLADAGRSTEYELKGRLGEGWSLLKAGKPAEAAAVFDEILGKKGAPEAIDVEAAFVRGRIAEEAGQNDLAMAMYDRIVQRHPRSRQRADALWASARLRDKLQRRSEAVALYERLDAEYPQFAKRDAVLYEWAWALLELEKKQQALGLLDRLYREYPESRFRADAAYHLAQQALEAKQYDRADKLLDELTLSKTEPRVRECALYLRGQVAVARTEWPKVREAFESLLREFPESRQRRVAEFWIAESLYRQSQFDAAAERFDRLDTQVRDARKKAKIPMEPWMGMISLRRAELLVQRKRWGDAYALASTIERDYPGFSQQYDVDYLLGRCLAMTADFESARRAYGRAIHSAAGAKTETAAKAQWGIGETFFHQKKYETAYREYLKVDILYAYPVRQAEALLEAGYCSEKLGQTKQAADCYRRITETYPQTPVAGEAAQRLARLTKSTNPKAP